MKALKKVSQDLDCVLLSKENVILFPELENKKDLQFSNNIVFISETAKEASINIEAFTKQMIEDMEIKSIKYRKPRMHVNEKRFGKFAIAEIDKPVEIEIEEVQLKNID